MSKTIHRAWLGPNPMPQDYRDYGSSWHELNPEWCSVLWTRADIEAKQWRNQPVIDDIRKRGGDSIEAAVQFADVISYEMIWEYGGLYINVDIEPVRPLEYFTEYYKISPDAAYAGLEDWTTTRIVNSMMGGPVKHPFWDYVITQLPVRYWADPTAEMVQTTGPVLLTDSVYYWLRKISPPAHYGNFMIIPRLAFNLVHWSQIPPGQNADGRWVDSPEVIAIHHWGHRKQQRSNLVRRSRV